MVDEENAAKRSDAVLEHELKTGAQSEMYSCHFCGGKKVTLKQQQTRGADEPMTNFFTCLTCGK